MKVTVPNAKAFLQGYRGLLMAVSLAGFQLPSLVCGAASPAFVQEKHGQITDGTSVMVTTPSSTTGGNLLVIYAVWDNTDAISLTDSAGNNFADAAGPAVWNDATCSAGIFYAKNIKGGPDTITANFSTAINNFGRLYVCEYSGIDTNSPLNASSVANGRSGSLRSHLIQITNPVDLVFAAGTSANGIRPHAPGFNTRGSLPGDMVMDTDVSARKGVVAAVPGRGGAWTMQVAAFKAAGATTLPAALPVISSFVANPASIVAGQLTTLSWAVSNSTSLTLNPGIGDVTNVGYAILDPLETTVYALTATNGAGSVTAQTTVTVVPDTEAPTAPGNLTATAVSSSEVDLAWTASFDNVGVAGYQIYRNGALVGATNAINYSDAGLVANTSYTFNVAAFDAAGNVSTQSEPLAMTTGPSLSSGSYSTSFPLTENPISEGGMWIGGKTAGLDWSDVAVTNHLAICTVDSTHNPTYNDSTAILTGTWGSNQTVTATLHVANQAAVGYPEAELRLRSSLSAHSCTGYEIDYSLRNDSTCYIGLVRWNGPYGSWTSLASVTGVQYAATNGSVLKATMIGNTITAYLNGVPVCQTVDGTFTNGNPGMGFDIDSSDTNQNGTFGFTSFSATDGR
ncbi:MAG TPA: fibronectin type III domain-containing protein [Candidatus Acidoferrales bacterium]|nr:fibronectin type III domain-containing protein [Candidatus Acidoferrales bacterium]